MTKYFSKKMQKKCNFAIWGWYFALLLGDA